MYDVLIVGAGVVGCAAARALARLDLRVAVLEKGNDVAVGASKANSGIVHAGYDADPGSNKARFNVAGQQMFDQLADELHIPFRRSGTLVLCFEEEGLPRLQALLEQGVVNGLTGLEILYPAQLRKLEPNLSDAVVAGLWAPMGGIVCPYELTLALGQNAAQNGVEFFFNEEVTDAERSGDGLVVHTPQGRYETRILVNAAGLYADTLNNMLSANKLEIRPRRGEYCLFDRTEGHLVQHVLFQLPTAMGKGVLLTPTVDGNLMAGPTSDEIEDKGDLATTREGLAAVLEKSARDITPPLPNGKIITSFSGLRAHLTTGDFVVGFAPDEPSLLNLAGIESPGLTSAPALGAEAARLVQEALGAKAKQNFDPIRPDPVRFRRLSNEQRAALIRQNPDYGRIVCRCESVTQGEILDALRGPLPAQDMDGLKRRTRSGMGRCQGGFCSMYLPALIAKERGIPLNQVTKCGGDSRLLYAPDKTDL